MNNDEINIAKTKVLKDAIQSLKLTLELNLVGGIFFQSQIKETLEILELVDVRRHFESVL